MTRADDAALKALIERQPKLAGKVFNTVAPNGTEGPYVVFFPSLSEDYNDRVTGPQVSRRPSYTLHSVGTAPESHLAVEQAQMASEWVDAQLRPGGRGVSPVVAGRRNGSIRRDVNAGVNVDGDVDPAYIYAVSEYSWGSDPA